MGKKLSKIYVENVYIEDLFEWMYKHIEDSAGDGFSATVCKNYDECSEIFKEWYENKFKCNLNKLYYKEENNNSVNYICEQEGFIFTNNVNINLSLGDYIFIIKGKCRLGYSKEKKFLYSALTY